MTTSSNHGANITVTWTSGMDGQPPPAGVPAWPAPRPPVLPPAATAAEIPEGVPA
jgi:hypothetical protein